ncbi:MAG: TPM domain-containing protein, partial [Chitinophagaceae bacterium]
MKNFFIIIGFLFSVSAFAQIDKVLPNPKSPPRLYNDFTKAGNFLTPEQAQALESKLVAYDDSTSSQVAIVIVDGLGGYEANEYATALGRKWGIGGKEFNNGILILISTGGGEGNRDAYIAVGYGLEGAIPDMIAAYIVDHEIIENFKQSNYYRGLDEATDAIIKAAAGEYKAPEGYGKGKGKGLKPWQIILLLFVIWTLMAIVGGRKGGGGMASRRGYRGWGGPFWGGGSGWSGGGGWS